MYLWQLPDWPDFTWDRGKVVPLLLNAVRKASSFIGKMEAVGRSSDSIAIDSMTAEVVSSSSIEGVSLSRDSVRSSISRHLGMTDGDAFCDHRAKEAVDIYMEAISEPSSPLTAEMLSDWNRRILSGNGSVPRSDIGHWRRGPVYVVSGSMGRETVHFEVPPPEDVPDEITSFLQFVNGQDDVDPVLKAGIAHLWFVTIHPFPDGNGRIARILMEMLLSRCDGNRRYYSMSRVIRSHRSEYYAVLERTETGSLDITIYLEWFLRTYMEAIEYSEKAFIDVLARTRIWDGLRGLDLNERQHRILGMLIDGFDGKLTAEKWARICRCSHATAVRDINALIASGVLSRDEGKARKASYSLIRP